MQAGATSLHLAAREGYHQVVVALINAGANVDAKDNVGKMQGPTCTHIVYATDMTAPSFAYVCVWQSHELRAPCHSTESITQYT